MVNVSRRAWGGWSPSHITLTNVAKLCAWSVLFCRGFWAEKMSAKYPSADRAAGAHPASSTRAVHVDHIVFLACGMIGCLGNRDASHRPPLQMIVLLEGRSRTSERSGICAFPPDDPGKLVGM